MISPAAARTALIVALLVIWELSIYLSGASNILVARPSQIAVAAWNLVRGASSAPDFYLNVGLTVFELVVAYAIAAVVGLSIGTVVANWKVLGDALEPLLLALYALPKVILYPIIVLTAGAGLAGKTFFGVLVGIFVIIFNTSAGLRQIDPNYLRLSDSLGFGPRRRFFSVILPAAAPTVLAGLRLGFGYTLIGVLTAELLTVNSGLGRLIDWASFNFYTPDLFALIFLAIGLGILGNMAFSSLERRWVR